MSDAMRYEYSVIRFVPDTFRGEFINLGVIVGSDQTREWELRVSENMTRARRFDSDALIESALSWLVGLQRRFDEHKDAIENNRTADDPITTDWLRGLAHQSRNLVQITAPSPVAAESVEAAMTLLFTQFVLIPEVAQRAKYVARSTAVASMARAYAHMAFGADNLARTPEVVTRKYAETFDFVVANGRAVQLTEAFSFAINDLQDVRQKVKSWSWTVHDLRNEGGYARLPTRQVTIPADVDIAAIVVRPEKANKVANNAFDEAVAAFDENHVTWVPVDQVGEIATRAALSLKRAQH